VAAALVKWNEAWLQSHTWQFIIFTIPHYHRLHLLLLAQYFILNSRLGSSANPFLHRPFPFLPDWLRGLLDHLTILLCSTAGFVKWNKTWLQSLLTWLYVSSTVITLDAAYLQAIATSATACQVHQHYTCWLALIFQWVKCFHPRILCLHV